MMEAITCSESSVNIFQVFTHEEKKIFLVTVIRTPKLRQYFCFQYGNKELGNIK
jgi:hypothetical protein